MVTNSNDEPSLRAGIFPKRFCMLELGTDLHEGYLTALPAPCPLLWDYSPFLLLSAGFSISEKPQTSMGVRKAAACSEVILAQVEMSCVCCKHFYTGVTVKEQQLLF